MSRYASPIRAIGLMVISNVIGIFILLTVVFSFHLMQHLRFVALIYMPTALIASGIFFGKKARGRFESEMIDRPKFRGSRGIFSYLCAGIFFLGICYGLLLVIAGELPKDYLFYLIFPAALMIYFLRLGRRISRRNFPNG